MRTRLVKMNKTWISLLALALTCSGWAQISLSQDSFLSVNSSNDEQNPVITPDGKYMYFTLRGHPMNTDGKRDPGDIWYSTLIDNKWSEPIHAGHVLNDRGYNAVAGFSADGSQMYLLSHYDPAGLPRTQGISVSRRSGQGWSRPENIFIPYFQNKSSIQSGHVSSDGKVFVYSAETYGTHGVDDLYVSIKGADGKWSEPRNLGVGINTQFQELCPSFSPDGTTLYYSSNGRKGMGSFDIYYSQRLDDTYTNWTDPVNLGPDANTEGRELFYRSFEWMGLSLYTSTKNSDGYGDVRFVSGDLTALDTLQLVIKELVDTMPPLQQIPEEIDSKSIRIYGKVTNARNGDLIRSQISFEGPDAVVEAEATGTGYTVVIPRDSKYTLKIEAPGYVSSYEKIDLAGMTMKDLELNFQLQPIEIGTTVNLKSVLFIQSKPELLPESYPELDLVVAFMNANPNVEIELAGHTDNRGSYRQLMELSQKRVNRVKDYMVSKGIDKKRITGRGYGGSQPVAGNDTEEGRMLNRRVEFIIKKS